jgi:hypothetical protein
MIRSALRPTFNSQSGTRILHSTSGLPRAGFDLRILLQRASDNDGDDDNNESVMNPTTRAELKTGLLQTRCTAYLRN